MSTCQSINQDQLQQQDQLVKPRVSSKAVRLCVWLLVPWGRWAGPEGCAGLHLRALFWAGIPEVPHVIETWNYKPENTRKAGQWQTNQSCDALCYCLPFPFCPTLLSPPDLATHRMHAQWSHCVHAARSSLPSIRSFLGSGGKKMIEHYIQGCTTQELWIKTSTFVCLNHISRGTLAPSGLIYHLKPRKFES